MKSTKVLHSAIRALAQSRRRLPPGVTRTCICPPTLRLTTTRFVSTQDQRSALLRRIYAPAAGLVKGSPEYNELAKSGRVWENHFQYGDSERYGYLDLQKIYTPQLNRIDTLRQHHPTNISPLLAAYAHQSVQIEDNHLPFSASLLLQSHLTPFFTTHNLSTLSATALSAVPYPDLSALLPAGPPSEVAELRNHLIASHWVAAARPSSNRPNLSEADIRALSVVVNRDTTSEELYRLSWGRRLELGDYRAVPIQVKSNPLAVFPYPDEVPALVGRFCTWLAEVGGKDRDGGRKELHPVILACQAVIYFVSIHPFPDGNGRVSRLVMQDLLMRKGYLPPVVEMEGREDYISLIRQAAEGRAGRWVGRVVRAVEEGLEA